MTDTLAVALERSSPTTANRRHLLSAGTGGGPLGRAKGEEIPLPMRVVHVATDAALQRLIGGEEDAARVVRERAGQGFDPAIADQLADDAAEVLALDLEIEPDAPALEGELGAADGLRIAFVG